MASSWIAKRATSDGGRFRVLYRLGGRETTATYAGSFKTKTEALARKKWVDGELAALRAPDLSALAVGPGAFCSGDAPAAPAERTRSKATSVAGTGRTTRAA